jgi:hypothetical protein
MYCFLIHIINVLKLRWALKIHGKMIVVGKEDLLFINTTMELTDQCIGQFNERDPYVDEVGYKDIEWQSQGTVVRG